MSDTYISYYDIWGDLDEIMDSVTVRAEQLKKDVWNILQGVEYADARDAVEEVAVDLAFEDTSDFAVDILKSKILGAASITSEYDYGLFVEQLLRAIEYNRSDLVNLKLNRGSTPSVFVGFNMNMLGNLDEYAMAVEAARNQLKLGGKDDMAARSIYWRNIYLVNRLGKTIKKTTYNKKGEKQVKDITEKFEGKYQDTIEVRMQYIDPDKAPFWELIDQGNMGVQGELNQGGMAFPVVPPANFVELAVRATVNFFENAYDRYLTAQLTEMAHIIMQDFLGAKTLFVTEENLQQLWNEIANRTAELVSDNYEEPVPIVEDTRKIQGEYIQTRQTAYKTKTGKMVRQTQFYDVRTGRIVALKDIKW